jgi:hypothetical protein
MNQTTSQETRFTFDMQMTGKNTATGSFTASEAVVDEGQAFQVFWYTNEGNVRGIKILLSQKGSITLKFDTSPQPDGVAIGHFVAIDGSGAYKNIQGQGDTHASLVFGPVAGQTDPVPTGITGSYTGKVHFEL